MDTKTDLKPSLTNLLFLAAGALIALLVFNSSIFKVVVHAQQNGGTVTNGGTVVSGQTVIGGGKGKETPPPTPPECEHAECIIPAVGFPSAAIGTLLVGRMASDSMTLNGFDLLKLQDGLLTALQKKGILTAAEAENIIKNAKVEKPLRVKPAQQ